MLKRSAVLCLILVMNFVSCGSDTQENPPIVRSNPVLLEGNQVGVYINNDGVTDVFKQGISFAEQVTAFEVLLQASITLVYQNQPWGAALCSIDGVGYPESNCLGDLGGNFWGFFHKSIDDDQWKFAQVGIDQYIIEDGDLIGLVWTGSDAEYNPLVVPDDSLIINDFFN